MMQGSLAERLRVLRARRGFTLTEAAERAGVQRQTLALLERGERHPHTPTLHKLAKGYGIPVEDLLEEPVSLAEAPETGRAVTPELAALVDRMAEAGDEEGLALVHGMLESERVRLGVARHDHPENPALRGEFARAVERLSYVGLRLEALRQARAQLREESACAHVND